MSKELQQSLSGQATAEQIAAWKKSHPNGIFALKNENGKIGYFKKPSWTEASYIASRYDADAPLDHIKEAAEMFFIGGDKSLLENDSELIGVVIKLRDQINGVQAEVVNL
jgi:hypothetical protein